jgi:hypothetical protein
LANFKRWKIGDGGLGDVALHSILSTNLYVVLNALNNFDVAPAIKFRLDAEAIQGIIDPDLVRCELHLRAAGLAEADPVRSETPATLAINKKNRAVRSISSPKLPWLKNLAIV